MAELLRALYDKTEGSKEAESVTDYRARFASDGEQEEMFLAAIHDTRMIGFREGMKAALQLFSEIHETDGEQEA